MKKQSKTKETNTSNFNLNIFVDLEKQFLSVRNKEKLRWEKEIKKVLSPYYTIKNSDYSNYSGDFYFMYTLTSKNGYKFELSVEDDNGKRRNGYKILVFAYEELPEEIEEKLKYVDDEDSCIFISTSLNKVFDYLIKLSKEVE